MATLFKNALLFFVPFSFVFWYVHHQFETAIFRSIQNGLSGFYSADGLIFGFLVAFVINREWEIWTKLSESVRTEIDAVRELWKWSVYADSSLCDEAHRHLEGYLKNIVSEWYKGGETERSKSVDDELDALRGMLGKLSTSAGSVSFQLQSALTHLIESRNQRLNFSNEHMPGILKRTVVFADILFIFLSLFIAVNNLYVDYIFTAAISLLAFTLVLVVDDLDNPFRSGTWHITPAGYEALLVELTRRT